MNLKQIAPGEIEKEALKLLKRKWEESWIRF